jgi:mRNA-degrading endonuclease toxin of MazEF toxin-antitoxin module
VQQLRQWDIWQVSWEHEDGTAKDRPALLFLPTATIHTLHSVPFIKISSKEHPSPYRFTLEPTDGAFAATGLRKRSHFYLNLVQFIERSKLRYRRGMLGPMTSQLLDLRIRASLPEFF